MSNITLLFNHKQNEDFQFSDIKGSPDTLRVGNMLPTTPGRPILGLQAYPTEATTREGKPWRPWTQGRILFRSSLGTHVRGHDEMVGHLRRCRCRVHPRTVLWRNRWPKNCETSTPILCPKHHGFDEEFRIYGQDLRKGGQATWKAMIFMKPSEWFLLIN